MGDGEVTREGVSFLRLGGGKGSGFNAKCTWLKAENNGEIEGSAAYKLFFAIVNSSLMAGVFHCLFQSFECTFENQHCWFSIAGFQLMSGITQSHCCTSRSLPFS